MSPVLELTEAPSYVHNKERNSFINLPNGKVLPTMNWLQLDSVNTNFDLPKIGEHTNSILSEIGFSKHQIDQFLKDKVVENYRPKSKI